MKQIMRQPEQFAAALGDQRMHRLIGIEEARPGHRRDVGDKRGRARPAIERVVAVPQWKPLFVVLPGDSANRYVAGHICIPCSVEERRPRRARRDSPPYYRRNRKGSIVRGDAPAGAVYSAARRCRARLRSPPPRSERK